MFRDDYYPIELNDGYSLANSLDKKSDNSLLLIHNQNFFQKGSINPNWILLDTGYPIGVFFNPILLKNIHRLEKMKNIHYNSGFFNVTHKGTLPGYGIV